MALQSSVVLPLIDTEQVRQAIKACGLFSLLVAADYSEGSVQFIRTCNLPAAQILIRYERDGKDVMVVNYKEKSYSFVITKAIRANMIGKMLHAGDSKVFFYHEPSLNGVQVLTDRIISFLPKSRLKSIHFEDPNRSIKDLAIQFPLTVKVSELIITKPFVTEPEIIFILMGFSDVKLVRTDTTFIECYESFPTVWDSAIVSNKLGLLLEQVEYMKNSYLEVQETNFTTRDMNHFIKTWLTEKAPYNLKCLRINKLREINRDELYAGINIYPWDQTVRSQYYQVHEGAAVSFHMAFDILRDDDVLASIIYENGVFMFVVWHERTHNLPDGCKKFEVTDFVY